MPSTVYVGLRSEGVHRSTDGGAVTAAEVTLDSMATGEWRDALVSLFEADPEDSNKGTLRAPDTSELCINSRTYNQTAVGTFGQLMPAVRLSEGFESGELMVIPGLKKNAAFRSNVGALNLSSFPVTVAVTLFNAAGDQAGDMVFITIGASEYGQIDKSSGWPMPVIATSGTPSWMCRPQAAGCGPMAR